MFIPGSMLRLVKAVTGSVRSWSRTSVADAVAAERLRAACLRHHGHRVPAGDLRVEELIEAVLPRRPDLIEGKQRRQVDAAVGEGVAVDGVRPDVRHGPCDRSRRDGRRPGRPVPRPQLPTHDDVDPVLRELGELRGRSPVLGPRGGGGASELSVAPQVRALPAESRLVHHAQVIGEGPEPRVPQLHARRRGERFLEREALGRRRLADDSYGAKRVPVADRHPQSSTGCASMRRSTGKPLIDPSNFASPRRCSKMTS